MAHRSVLLPLELEGWGWGSKRWGGMQSRAAKSGILAQSVIPTVTLTQPQSRLGSLTLTDPRAPSSSQSRGGVSEGGSA